MKTLTTALSLVMLPLGVQTSSASAIERELFGQPLAIRNAEVIVCTQNDYVIQFVESGLSIKRYVVSVWQAGEMILLDYEAVGFVYQYSASDTPVEGFVLSGFRPVIGKAFAKAFAREFPLNESSMFLISYGEKFATVGNGAFVSNISTFESDPVLGGYMNAASCSIGK